MTKSETRMEFLTKAATVMTKLFEIAYSVGAVGLTVGFVLFLTDRTLVQGPSLPGEELSIHGFSIVYTNLDGTINDAAVILFLLAGAGILELMAWVFRNANLILRTTQGLTKFSQGKTPFQKENVRMMREIGIFFLAIAVIELVCSFVAFLAVGAETAEVSADIAGPFITGLLMLCLSQVFAIGQTMQEDIDGLV